MKKSFILFLLSFAIISVAYCDEALPNSSKQKQGVFSKLLHKKNKKPDVEQKGYYGTIPNIEKNFEYKKDHASNSPKTDANIPTPEELKQDNLKSLPLNDKLLLDNVIKKPDSSNYVNDIQRTRVALENLKKCIEEKGTIQRFNGCVNVLDLYVQNLEKKYSNTSDTMRTSYFEIVDTTYASKTLGNLLYDANYYSRYIPTNEGKYSEENLALEKQNLLNRINKTLFLISQED